jgi:hypothetical protein
MEIFELPALTSLLSGEYPATELFSTVNSNIAPSLLSLPSRDRLNCQHSTDCLTHQPNTSLHFTQLNCTQLAWDPRYVASGRTHQKTPFVYRCAHVRVSWNVFTEPLLRNRLHNHVVLLLRACMLQVLPSNGRCLQSHRLATGLYATIYLQAQQVDIVVSLLTYIWGCCLRFSAGTFAILTEIFRVSSVSPGRYRYNT